jgi:hypothetical protein
LQQWREAPSLNTIFEPLTDVLARGAT